MTALFERLASAGIQLAPASESAKFFVFERNGCVALVERTGDEFGRIGASGRLTEQGFAVLQWRGAEVWLVGRGHEKPATADQAAEIQAFSKDLKAALSGSPA
ncbi:MAG: hypothetical protein FJW40_05825 [Acidobacteria bacterium]|nr:hypothetical protein [Acidobacteriota bacterium]